MKEGSVQVWASSHDLACLHQESEDGARGGISGMTGMHLHVLRAAFCGFSPPDPNFVSADLWLDIPPVLASRLWNTCGQPLCVRQGPAGQWLRWGRGGGAKVNSMRAGQTRRMPGLSQRW